MEKIKTSSSTTAAIEVMANDMMKYFNERFKVFLQTNKEEFKDIPLLSIANTIVAAFLGGMLVNYTHYIKDEHNTRAKFSIAKDVLFISLYNELFHRNDLYIDMIESLNKKTEH